MSCNFCTICGQMVPDREEICKHCLKYHSKDFKIDLVEDLKDDDISKLVETLNSIGYNIPKKKYKKVRKCSNKKYVKRKKAKNGRNK